ncbi:protein of unknown function [Quadrisphaera granulorum]|uniref:Ferric nitrobindin-like protein n=1 Tax=Quadrisphaera granulorum TaxID=317664 RepID=A0A316ANU8_9ACTN|nr:FABP family protein [Quadrisphaera granulorum]PWJ51757.1 uncharacterized protein DUF1794 [Quadrisphaera granulorum]SZE97704.1 protein of unknown function [Quadrisphaera granulorum]
MPLEIDASLPASLVPLSWLVGRWAGAGVIASPEAGESQVGQEVDVIADERGFLSWSSRVWRLDAEGRRTEPLDTETGYWRTSAEQSSPGKPGVDVELLLAHPTGIVEVFVGRVLGTRVEMVTDAVVRTAGASDYTAAKRTFGQVEGDLLWVLDVASSTEPLHPRLSARLRRVG